jgi:hypothetical protein
MNPEEAGGRENAEAIRQRRIIVKFPLYDPVCVSAY